MPSTSSATEGSGMRNIAALPVPGVLHIVKPFPVKLGHIERQDRTFHDYLRVSGIGQPLPVRTVTADTTVEVIFLRSQVNLVDLVKQFVRTTETSGRPWIGMHDFCHQTFPAHPDLSGYNFDIAKRMPSETRLPLFYSTTPQCIKVTCPKSSFSSPIKRSFIRSPASPCTFICAQPEIISGNAYQ